jgi:hypothetical protein
MGSSVIVVPQPGSEGFFHDARDGRMSVETRLD